MENTRLKEDVEDELLLRIEGLEFIAKGLFSISCNPDADMTLGDFIGEYSTFYYLAREKMNEMRKILQGEAA